MLRLLCLPKTSSLLSSQNLRKLGNWYESLARDRPDVRTKPGPHAPPSRGDCLSRPSLASFSTSNGQARPRSMIFRGKERNSFARKADGVFGRDNYTRDRNRRLERTAFRHALRTELSEELLHLVNGFPHGENHDMIALLDLGIAAGDDDLIRPNDHAHHRAAREADVH